MNHFDIGFSSGMEKAALFGFGKKKPPSNSGMKPQHISEVSTQHRDEVHALADKYHLDRGHAHQQHGPWHRQFPGATEHNIAAESDAQLTHGGKGVKWDKKKWGHDNPLL